MDDIKIGEIEGAEDLTMKQLCNVLRFIKEVNKHNSSIDDFLSLNASFIGMDSSEEKTAAIKYLKNHTNNAIDPKLSETIMNCISVKVDPHNMEAYLYGVKIMEYTDYVNYTYTIDSEKLKRNLEKLIGGKVEIKMTV